MKTHSENNNTLLDEDPALDYIRHQEMEEEEAPQGKIGWLGLLLILLLPACYGILHFTVVCPITSSF